MIKYYICTNDRRRKRITNAEEFVKYINRIKNKIPIICFLESNKNEFITMGISTDYGFFQYSSEITNNICKIAISKLQQDHSNSYLEFDCGGTPTPIPMSKCLPIDIVIKIACDFIEKGILSDQYNWEVV